MIDPFCIFDAGKPLTDAQLLPQVAILFQVRSFILRWNPHVTQKSMNTTIGMVVLSLIMFPCHEPQH